jgi:hypothetical protein
MMNAFLLGLLAFIPCLPVRAIDSRYCEPARQIRAQAERAMALPVSNAMAFDENMAPFLSLRARHPGDLFVHEYYQNAVWQYGIEGHLRLLTQQYQRLSLEHPGDVVYRYLCARARMGRSTPSAIGSLTEILTENHNFALAHRALAEIYGSEAFHDPQKEQTERVTLLALCPGSTLAPRPGALSSPYESGRRNAGRWWRPTPG